MRRSNDFSLFTISDVPYLLPFGQGIADLKRGVRINDTGIYLWELLEQERTEEEILTLYATHFEIADSQIPQLKADLRQFLQLLEHYGMLLHSDTPRHSGTLRHSDSLRPSDSLQPSGERGDSGSKFKSNVCTQTPVDRISEDNTAADCKMVHHYLAIGGLTILLNGPDEAFAQNFDAFEIFTQNCDPTHDNGVMNSPTADRAVTAANSVRNVSRTVSAANGVCNVSQTVSAAKDARNVSQIVSVISHAPDQRSGNRILLRNPELVIMEDDIQYVFLFPNAPGICEAHLTKDGTDARYYCLPPYTDALRQDLFHAIRLSFLYLAQLHHMVVLHSASLLYRGKAWLFSGHSGAGKSTHTNLWKDIYNVPLLNGDLNMLSVENGQPTVHGLPWCGTSGISDIGSYPLGGILLVKKSSESRAVPLSDDAAQLLVTQRLISPGWTEALLQKNLDIIEKLAPSILTCRLYCTKSPDAVEAGKKAIDEYLNKKSI